MDPFSHTVSTLDSPARSGAALTPDDTADLGVVTRAVYVGGGGSLAVELADGASVSFAGVPAGAILPVRIKRLMATGTTASGIVGLW